MSDCIFCKIANKEIDSQLIFEDDKVVAFRDLNPQAPQHILIIPKKHFANILEVIVWMISSLEALPSPWNQLRS